jgi:hypothetical protein
LLAILLNVLKIEYPNPCKWKKTGEEGVANE